MTHYKFVSWDVPALNKTDIRKELKSNVIEIMEVKKN